MQGRGWLCFIALCYLTSSVPFSIFYLVLGCDDQASKNRTQSPETRPAERGRATPPPATSA